MHWLPSTRRRYLLLGCALLAILAVLDALVRAVSGWDGMGLALIVWACFGTVYAWLALEPMVSNLMAVGIMTSGDPLSRVQEAAADVAGVCGIAPPPVMVFLSDSFEAMTTGLGRRATVFVSSRVAELPNEELRAIIAHECGHLALSHPVARLGLMGSLLALAMLASSTPFVALTANFFVLWCLRQMEFQADGVAARAVGASALREALGRASGLVGEAPRWQSVFNTHPRFADRISKLGSETV